MPNPALTESQLRETAEVLEKHSGNISAAARELGIGRSAMQNRRRRLNDDSYVPRTVKETEQIGANGETERTWGQSEYPRAAVDGPDPGGRIVRTTEQIGPDGTERIWQRRVPDPLSDAMERIDEILAGIDPLEAIAKTDTEHYDDDLHCLYPFSDAHIGMLAWAPETDADWDCKIASRTLKAAADQLMLRAPPTKTASIVLLGDWLHADGLEPVTPTSRHILDADSRFEKLVDVAIDIALHITRRALEFHESVDLLIAEGNHDIASSIWMRKLFGKLFADEPRIAVIDSPKPYYVKTFGETFLGFHHGHLKKSTNAAEMIAYYAQEFREEWGRCSKHYLHCGHRHHLHVDGSKGATIHQHPTLAARDAYAARGGYTAYRFIKALVYHRAFGETMSINVTPEMFEGSG